MKRLGVLNVFGRRRLQAGAGWSTGAAVLALSLVVLTTVVATGGPSAGLDGWVDERLPRRGGGNPTLHSVAEAITTLANPPLTMALLLAAVALWALRSRTLWPVVAAAPAVVGLTVTVLVSKWLLARPGPPGSDPVDILGAYPSGHTATALVCTGTLAVLLARGHSPYRRALTLAVTGWTILVAWSLLWLHYHWLSDVLGGALLGALLLWLLYRWPWYLVARSTPRCEGTELGTRPQDSTTPRPEPDQSPAKTQDPRPSFEPASADLPTVAWGDGSKTPRSTPARPVAFP